MSFFGVPNGFTKSSTENLYSQKQAVRCKFRSSDELGRILRINVSLHHGVCSILHLEILDDEDLCFMYSMHLTQEDFRVLKTQQCLLVDFDHFPSQLIKLLETCRHQNEQKFVLFLSQDDDRAPNNIYLNVVETNPFKNLSHLSLQVVPGTDNDIKTHMASKIKSLNEKITLQDNIITNIETKLTETLKQLERENKIRNELELKYTEEKTKLQLDNCSVLTEEREKSKRCELDLIHKLETEKTKIETQHQILIKDLQEQISSLTFNNKNLYEAKCQTETDLKEKIKQMILSDKQILKLEEETSHWRKQNQNLEQTCKQSGKNINTLKTQVAVLEQKLQDKEIMLNKIQSLLTNADEQRHYLDKSLREREMKIQEKNTKINQLDEDIKKANEIIEDHLTKLANFSSKLKKFQAIASKQEIVIQGEYEKTKKQAELINKLEEDVRSSEKQLAEAQHHLIIAEKKMAEDEILIKKKDDVIKWLNKTLTEQTLQKGENPEKQHSNPAATSNIGKNWPAWLSSTMSSQPTTARSNLNSIAGDSSVSTAHVAKKSVDLNKYSPPVTTKLSPLEADKQPHLQMENTKLQTSRPIAIDPKYYTSKPAATSRKTTSSSYFPNSVKSTE